jgi:hypothetical protein
MDQGNRSDTIPRRELVPPPLSLFFSPRTNYVYPWITTKGTGQEAQCYPCRFEGSTYPRESPALARRTPGQYYSKDRNMGEGRGDAQGKERRRWKLDVSRYIIIEMT